VAALAQLDVEALGEAVEAVGQKKNTHKTSFTTETQRHRERQNTNFSVSLCLCG
jgi:hypothetical protein